MLPAAQSTTIYLIGLICVRVLLSLSAFDESKDWFTMYYREPGESLSVHCNGKNVRWYRIANGRADLHLIKTQHVSITNVSSKDSGLFVCVHSEEAVISKQFFYLTTAAYELLDPSWEGDEVALVGKSFQRECVLRPQINFTIPVKLTVRKDSSIDNVLIHGGSLTIQSLTYEHEGRYICLLKTKNEIHAARIFNLRPQGPPQLISTRETIKYIKDGESGVILECPVFGLPVPHVVWSFDGDVNSSLSFPEQPTLELARVDVSSEGTYTCVASNKHGTANGIVKIIVLGAPVMDESDAPVELLNEGNMSLIVAQCPFSSPMSTHYSWSLHFKNGTELPVEHNNEGERLLRLEFISEKVNELHALKCEASNKFGKASKQIEANQIRGKREFAAQKKNKASSSDDEYSNNIQTGLVREQYLADDNKQSSSFESTHKETYTL